MLGTFPEPRADLRGKGAHLLEDAVDARHDVVAVDEDRRVAAVAERDVQHRAVLGNVDPVAGKHAPRARLHAHLPRQRDQVREHLGRDAVLAVVQQDLALAPSKDRVQAREPLGIRAKQRRDRRAAGPHRLRSGAQARPRRGERRLVRDRRHSACRRR